METILHLLPLTGAQKAAFQAAAPESEHLFLPTNDRGGSSGSKMRPDMGPLLVPVGGQALIDGQEHGQHVFRHGWAVGSHGGGEAHAPG